MNFYMDLFFFHLAREGDSIPVKAKFILLLWHSLKNWVNAPLPSHFHTHIEEIKDHCIWRKMKRFHDGQRNIFALQ